MPASVFKMQLWPLPTAPIAAMILYPPAMLLLQWFLHGCSYDTNSPALQSLVRAHNVLLCFMSVVLCLGTLVTAFRQNPYSSTEQFFCLSEGLPLMPPELRFWVDAFYMSKYWELLDTVLLVLRKKPLSFLHVYHHAVVIPEMWMFTRAELPWSLGCVVMNSGVHVVMYYYFAASSGGRRIWWRKYVTILQIAQFCTAIPSVIAYAWFHFNTVRGCNDVNVFFMIGAFDGSLLVLFLQFYLATAQRDKAADKIK